jgi:UDP-N-acetylmuramyl tripeptide synthase
VTSARYALGRAVGSTAASLSRLTGRGDGTTIGGRLTLAIAPTALADAAAGRELALVSGTNGKTTTRSFVVAALETLGPVVSNAGGANLPTGLTAALARDRRSARGVLEVDEPFLPRVIDAVRPRAVTLLNLSRDQLDRYAEVRRLASIWRDALGDPAGPAVIANCDDPLVTWAATSAPSVVWVAAGQRWHDDTSVCPECGGVLSRSGTDWWSECGLRRPDPAWRTEGTTVIDVAGAAHDVHLGVPGVVNVGNAALAAATAGIWGVQPNLAFEAMSAITTVEGRYLSTHYEGSAVRLLLAKNPAGWTEALTMVPARCRDVVVAVNARAADGRDPSWLWDVPFEQLAGRRAVATGERSRDVALRLRYAGVECVRVDDPATALRTAGQGGSVEVLANYTAFQAYRRVVADA